MNVGIAKPRNSLCLHFNLVSELRLRRKAPVRIPFFVVDWSSIELRSRRRLTVDSLLIDHRSLLPNFLHHWLVFHMIPAIASWSYRELRLNKKFANPELCRSRVVRRIHAVQEFANDHADFIFYCDRQKGHALQKLAQASRLWSFEHERRADPISSF